MSLINMADGKITNKELVEELRRFGEDVSLPLKPGKRPILIKKLNHLRSKHKKEDQPSRKAGRRSQSHLDVLSSDDSDIESAGQVDRQRSKNVSGVSKSLRRRSTANATTSQTTPKHDTRRPPLGRPSLRSSRKTETPVSSPRLYPDLRGIEVNPGNSLLRDDTFESSDSDLDESTYEVENKSVNTTFTIESNSSKYDSEGKSPLSHSRQSKSNTSYSNHQTPTASPSPKPSSANHKSAKYANNSKKHYKLYPEHVSGGLLVIVGGFFMILAISYLLVRRDVIVAWYSEIGAVAIPKTAPKSEYKLCSGNKDTDCYQEHVVEQTMVVIRDLYDMLSARKGLVMCGTADEWEKDMSVDQFTTYVGNLELQKVDVEEIVKSCLDLILLNPHWNVRAVKKDRTDATKLDDIHHLESAVASMGLMCRIRRSFYRVTMYLVIIVIGCVLAFAVLKYLKWRNAAKEKELRQVYSMVDEIIDILKRHHDMTQDDSDSAKRFLAAQHIRDQLLLPSKRKELLPIWEKAVQFIEKNESRIRLEDEIIEGEEFRVWRWIQNSPNGGKVWQGQAFGEHSDDNTSNTVMICPTPCLKIRNMFDADMEGEESLWEVNIADALLEKCKNVDSIHHIYVDKDSKEGCVYMKCSSREAAGRTRQSLHGWWFDRRLVTVRYLKLDYYHSRFPESINSNAPLLPSTNQMSSLSQPFYRSSLEMT